MEDYGPYGDEWKKEVSKFSFKNLEKAFGIVREKGESKKEIIDRLKLKLTSKQ